MLLVRSLEVKSALSSNAVPTSIPILMKLSGGVSVENASGIRSLTGIGGASTSV